MANFSQSFTGKDVAIRLPENEALKGQERLSDIITKAEDLRFKTFKENRDKFLEMANVNPVFVLSDSARKYQMKLLSEFNTKYGKLMRDRQGRFTTDDLLNMQTDKNFIISEQARQKADMDRFMQQRELVSRYPDKYDLDKFMLEADKYYTEGKFDMVRPPLKAKDPTLYLNDLANKERGEYMMGDKSDQVTMPSGEVGYVTYNIDPKGVGAWLEPRLLGMPEQEQLGLVEIWSNLPQVEKDKWLNASDVNQDKKIDEGERKNAILEWSKAYFGPKVLKRNMSTPSGVAGANKKGMSNLKAFGKNTSYAPTEAKPTRLGQTDYSNYHTFNNLPAWDIPVGTTIRLLNPKGEKEMKPDNTLSVDITGYDEDKDEFTFIVKSNFENLFGAVPAMERGKDWRIAIKRKDLPPEYNTLEIMKNGKVVKVGDIKRESVTITPTPAKGEQIDIGL